MTPDFTLIWPLSCLKDGVHLCYEALRPGSSRFTLTMPAGVLEAAKGFRRVKGCQDMLALVAALRARDARLGFGESSAMVA